MRKSIWSTTMLVLALAACSDGGSGGKADSGTDTDVDTDVDTDTDTDTDADTDTDSDTDTDTDVDTDTDTDTDTDDTDTETYENPCDDPDHAGCYADNVWCLDPEDVPQSQLDECTGGEQCVELTDEYAECQCVGDWYQGCYSGDAWAYDSCDELDHVVDLCEDTEDCVMVDDVTAACCEPEVKQQCGADGNIHWFDSCDLEGALVETCPDNADCENVDATTASCECRNHWEGEDCETCPGNWDPLADCAECAGEWTGDDCETCGGYGDNCQCPDSTYTPQPGTNLCWTCTLDETAVDGVCPIPSIANYFSWTEASAACPSGFRIPTNEEVSALFEGCDWYGDELLCAGCESSSPCSSMYSSNFGYPIWTADSCDVGSYWRAGIEGSTACFYCTGHCVEETTIGANVICVR